MRAHAHKFKVINSESVFGLHNIHAVMKCVWNAGTKTPCKKKVRAMRPISDFEKHGKIRYSYFYTPRVRR